MKRILKLTAAILLTFGTLFAFWMGMGMVVATNNGWWFLLSTGAGLVAAIFQSFILRTFYEDIQRMEERENKILHG